MFIRTKNSVYELDEAAKQVRRLNGLNDPTPCFGADGQWRPYADAYNVEVGQHATFVWPGLTRCTHTSQIQAVEWQPHELPRSRSARMAAQEAERQELAL